jgi:DNA-binding GntR family transcriptional regulator
VIDSSLRGHAVILDALERGDAEAARDAMIAHLAHVRDALDQEDPA